MLPIRFPTNLERLRQQSDEESGLTPDARLELVFEMLNFAHILNPAGDVFGSEDPAWCRHEADWQRRMLDVFKRRNN